MGGNGEIMIIERAIILKIIDPIRKGHNSVSIYHRCPHCEIEDWGSIMLYENYQIVECQCGENYLLEKKKRNV